VEKNRELIMATVELDLITDHAELARYISGIIKEVARSKSRKIAHELKVVIQGIIRTSIEVQPAYHSLVSSGPFTLSSMFGLSDGKERIESIVNTLINSIKVVISSVPGRKIGVYIDVVSSLDYDDLIRLRAASVSIEGGSLPWLEWLLTRGSEILIADYDVAYGDFPESRSGSSIMVASSSGFSIPPEFAGTASDNFFTRAIEDAIPNITTAVETIIPRVFNA
jgi:hypothetical protein